MRNLGPKYEKEFFLITNPEWYADGRKADGSYWHCFEDANGQYHECEYAWDDRFQVRGGVQAQMQFDAAEYKREYASPKSYYIFVDYRCKLRRWMKENFKP